MSKRMTGRQIIVILTVISASILEIIDATIVNIAIPDLMGNLGATITEAGWVITSYAAANIVMISLAAWMGSKLGRRNYFVLSIAVFTLGSLFCGLSDNIWELVFFRFVQGMGGGALIATAQAIIVESFPKERLNFANAIFGTGVVFGPAIGPLLGGYILTKISWHWIFYINLPFGVIATVMAWVFITEPKEKATTGKMDWLGLVLLIAGFGALLTVLENGQDAGWFNATYIQVLSVVSVVGTILFVIRQSYVKHPIMHFRVLKNVYFTLGIIINFMVATGMASMFLIFPLFAQNMLGYDPLQTGFAIFPGVVVIILVMPFVGRLPQKWYQLLFYMLIGFLLVVVYNMYMTNINQNANEWELLMPMIVRGLGISVLFIPLATISLIGLRGKEIPEGTGIYNLVRKIGNSLGVALTTTFFSRRIDAHESILSSNLHMGADVANQYQSTMMAIYRAAGVAPSDVQALAAESMSEQITRQAYLLSFIDSFLFAAVFFSACIPLLFIFFFVKKYHEHPVKPSVPAVDRAI